MMVELTAREKAELALKMASAKKQKIERRPRMTNPSSLRNPDIVTLRSRPLIQAANAGNLFRNYKRNGAAVQA
jgi:hypothetical protein